MPRGGTLYFSHFAFVALVYGSGPAVVYSRTGWISLRTGEGGRPRFIRRSLIYDLTSSEVGSNWGGSNLGAVTSVRSSSGIGRDWGCD